MLQIKNISKTFNAGTVNEKRALKNVSLTLENGDFVTVIGGNGAGKSTMLNAIAGVWPVDEGQIIIDGQDVTKLPEYKRALFLGRVFQDPMNGTAATMGIEENLALALRRGNPHKAAGFPAMYYEKDCSRIALQDFLIRQFSSLFLHIHSPII